MNTAFILPNKCAKTSIETAIRDGINVPYDEWKGWVQRHQVEDERGRITVAAVRNPFDRLVSCYIDQCLQKNSFPVGDCTFERFVEYVLGVEHEEADKHFKPLYMTVPERVCFLLRFETLKPDWDAVRKTFPNLPPLGHENKNPRPHWSRYYTNDTLNKVYSYYRKDFARYGY